MHVAVIGAGPAGLVAIKELLEEGHTVVCFEQASDIGGVFRFTENGGGVFESTRLTSSTFITCFSDFLPPEDAALHMRHFEYLDYLRRYSEHFHLLPCVRFSHHVEEVKQAASDRWLLRVRDLSLQETAEHAFDAVAVCSGTHQKPVVPRLPNQASFKGTIVHSNNYKRPVPFAGKDVVVVGGGESASDIIEEVSAVAKSCVLSLRRGVLMVPRLILGLPNDYYTDRLFYTVPAWLFRGRHDRFHWPSFILLLLALPVLAVPVVLLVSAADALLSSFRYGELAGVTVLATFLVYFCARIMKFLLQDVTPKDFGIIAQLRQQSGAGHGEQFATKCLGLVKAIAQGRCVLKGPIREFTGDGVRFADGSVCRTDAVIFCTGFVTSFPFLGRETLDVRTLYKNCFDVKLGARLCFLGLSRPGIGAIPPIAEMQARWFAALLSGRVHLPSREAMNREIKEDAERHRKVFQVVSDRISGLVDYTSYMDELAGFVGCRPDFRELLREPRLLYRIYNCPFSGNQYRLRGPHSKKEIAKSALYRMRIGIFKRLQGYGLCCIILTGELLYRLGWRQFKPHLRLWAGAE